MKHVVQLMDGQSMVREEEFDLLSLAVGKKEKWMALFPYNKVQIIVRGSIAR